jgi:hypothetical protein
VYVFERLVPLEFLGFDLSLNSAQSIVDLLLLVGGYDARCSKGRDVGDRSRDIVSIKPLVERNGFIVAQRYFRCRLAESFSPDH